MELWKTGNAEARVLALQVADPAKLTRSDADAERVLTTIEKEIHLSSNWARYAMNNALISIGVFKPALRKKAIAAARRIGKVLVDHGDTNCKTPDAIPYIGKASKRKRYP